MKNKGIVYIILGIMLISIALAQAPPPLVSTTETNCQILHPFYEYHEQNMEFDYYWHVFNASTLLTNTSVTCAFHLYDKQKAADHILAENIVDTYSNGRDFEVTANPNNASNLGDYCYIIECSGTAMACGVRHCFTVTPTGKHVDQPQAYIYIIGLTTLILLMLGMFILMGYLPSQDTRDDSGAILQINQLKHLRAVLWSVIWLIALAIVFVVMNISVAYLNSEMMARLFFAIYQIMFWVTIIMLPIYFIYIILKFFKDKEFQRMIERGIEVKTP